MCEPHDAAPRDLQDGFDTRRLADRLAESASERISEAHRAVIEVREMFLIATADTDGSPEVSYKGRAPGFVHVLDERTLAFPLSDGNGMYLTVGNLVVNPRVGLRVIDLERRTRLRVNGDTSIDSADLLLDTSPGAQLVVRVTARAVSANCRRYVHRCRLLEASPFVPEAGHRFPHIKALVPVGGGARTGSATRAAPAPPSPTRRHRSAWNSCSRARRPRDREGST